MDAQNRETRTSEHVFVVGRQPFQNYLRFVRSKWAGRTPPDEKLLAQQWREIQKHCLEVDEREVGIADDPGMFPLPDEMIPIAMEARQQESIDKSFGMLPCQWWLVEIDRLVVYQPWVDLSFSRELEDRLPRPLGHEDHIRLAAGTFAMKPTVTAAQTAEDKYVFLSPSTDVRFLGATLLDPAVVQGMQPRGFPTHVIAVFVGSSVNCLSAVQVERRLILLNGTHRAFALRSMGFTHIACLVTHVKNQDDKAKVLPPNVTQDAPRFLTSRRPPLFKDYFDASVRRVISTQSTQTLLTLRLNESKEIVPASSSPY